MSEITGVINVTNLVKGGALQVGSSIIKYLIKDEAYDNKFLIVYNQAFDEILKGYTGKHILIKYDLKPQSFKSVIAFRKLMQKVENQYKPKVFFSVFGPAYYKSKAIQINGFAQGHHIFPNSPFFRMLNIIDMTKYKIKKAYHIYNFKRETQLYWVESNFVKSALSKELKVKEDNILVATNNSHQIYEEPSNWTEKSDLPKKKEGEIWFLNISANYAHKNLSIIVGLVPELIKRIGDKFKFLLTITEHEFPIISEDIKKHIHFIGKVKVEECPHLYKKSDFVFLPTLLESFSASYPEAMKMQKIILTSNLPFAKAICDNAAVYFDPMNVMDIADKIKTVVDDHLFQENLIHNGTEQVLSFDSPYLRFQKIMDLINRAGNNK